MFHNRTWPLSEFAYRTQRYRISPLSSETPSPVNSVVYDGQDAGFISYDETLNGQTASFTTYSQTISPPDASGNYPFEEA